jgi:hypothetical protein
MNMKEHILAALKEQFENWQAMLAGMNDRQITSPHLPSTWSIKDEIVHLWAWQQRTSARLVSVRSRLEPVYPVWDPRLDPNSEDDLEGVNDWIYQANRSRPWSDVYRDWSAGYQRMLELGSGLPEKELLDSDSYPWLNGRPVALSLLGTYDHHQEHLANIQAWLKEHA